MNYLERMLDETMSGKTMALRVIEKINWLGVLIMLNIHFFRVNPHSVVAWMSRNFLLETDPISEV